MDRRIVTLFVVSAMIAAVLPASAATFHGGERLEGHGAHVASFLPGTPAEDEGWRDPTAALGVGDCIIEQPGHPPPAGCMVSLGRGGVLELELDKPASADGTPTSDLWVGECCDQWELDGPMDPLRVEGLNSEGEVLVTVEGVEDQTIDLDELGLRSFDLITRVRITDLTTADIPDDNAGADIDSVTSFRAVNQAPSGAIFGQWRQVGGPMRLSFSANALGSLGGAPPGAECVALDDVLLGINRDSWEVSARDCDGTLLSGFALLDDVVTLRMCLRPASAGASVPHECTEWFAVQRAPILMGADSSDEMITVLVLWVLHILLGFDETVDSAPLALAQAGQRPLVYVATDDAFPDALAVAGITGLTSGFTLLIDPDDPSGNAALLQQVDPREVVIIGGPAAIPDDAVPDDGTPRRRLGGDSRFDTAALLSREHFTAPADTVYIATGGNYPDALAGGAIASIQRAPILLVDGDRIPSETDVELRRLAPRRIVVLGGPAVVPDAVVQALDGYTTGEVVRVAGADRTETAVRASQAAFPDGADIVVVANAEDFRSAEGAAGAAWAIGGPLLLVRPSGAVPPAVRQEIVRLNPDRLVVAAADGELSEEVLAELIGLR